MIIRLVALIIVALNTINIIEAQIKYEKEYRINRKDVPEMALDFVDKLEFRKKVKWYKEEGLDSHSIEAKTKHLSKKYSIEFNTKGEIEDVEIQLKFKEVESEVRQNILKYLNDNYQKTKICKVQIQFSGNPSLLIKAIRKQDFKNNPDIVTRYELVVKAKGNNKYQKLEFLFDHSGAIISKTVILLKNTDNLEY